MPWTTPKTWTATVVPVSDLNVHIRDNENLLKTSINDDGTLKTIKDRKTSTTDVVNTTTETDAYSYTIAAGTFSTLNSVTFTGIGDCLNNSGSNKTLTIRVKLGATTIYTEAFTIATSATRNQVTVDAVVMAAGATNAQRSRVFVWLGTAGSGVDGTGSPSSTALFSTIATHSSVAEDSTTALALKVTYQWGTADANASARMLAGFTEIKA